MSDAAEALKRWAWAFHNGDYTNAPQAVADLRGAARYIAELEARLQPHKAGRTNTAEMARAMYQKQCEYVGPQHEEECVTMLTLAFDSFEDRIAELEAENERLKEAILECTGSFCDAWKCLSEQADE